MEKRFAILTLLIYTGILSIPSYNNVSDGMQGFGVYTASTTDKVVALMRYGSYALTIFLLIVRLKSVVRPALRDPFLWALMGIVVTSFLWSDFPGLSRKNGLLTLLSTLFGLYLASRYSLREQVRLLAWTFGIAAVFSLLYTLAFPGHGIEQGIHAGAWRGPLIQKNLFARFMVIGAIPLFMTALSSKRYRYLLWTVFGLAVALILLTTSKTALLIFLTLIVLLPLYKGLQWGNSIAVPFFIILIIVGASGATWLVNHWESMLLGLGKDTTLTGRTYIWEFVIAKIWERPWLGYGYEAFWQPGGEGENVKHYIFLTLSQAHNGYLDIMIHLGLIGMFFFMMSLLTAYIRGIAWARLGGKLEDLWPITYISFLLLYNQTESTIVETNSLYWLLYVSVTLSMKYLRLLKPGELESFQEEKDESKAINC